MSEAMEAFESEAEMFYKATGFLAPGKSESTAAVGKMDFDRHEVRSLMKKAWDAGRTLSDSQAKTIEGLRETLRGCSNFLEVFIAKGDEEGAGSMLYKEVRAALSRLSPAKEVKP